MKKLLVILLFFFPVHGAGATDYEFFGIKIGEKIQKYKSDFELITHKTFKISYGNRKVPYTAIEVQYSLNFDTPKKNKHFNNYEVIITPTSNKIHTIKASGSFKGPHEEEDKLCEMVLDEFLNIISSKYSIPFNRTPETGNYAGKSYSYYFDNMQIEILMICKYDGYDKSRYRHIKFTFVDKNLWRQAGVEFNKIEVENDKKIKQKLKEKEQELKEKIDTQGIK